MYDSVSRNLFKESCVRAVCSVSITRHCSLFHLTTQPTIHLPAMGSVSYHSPQRCHRRSNRLLRWTLQRQQHNNGSDLSSHYGPILFYTVKHILQHVLAHCQNSSIIIRDISCSTVISYS